MEPTPPPHHPLSPPQKQKKKVLIFREIELSNSKMKKFIIFSQESPLHFLASAPKVPT